MSPRTARAALAAALAVSTLAGAGAAASPVAAAKQPLITIGGSETTGALVADLIYYYRRLQKNPPRFRLTQGGTGLGVADAFRGIVSVGLAARDRRGDDPAVLTFTPAALSGVCIATGKGNALRNITRAQLQDLVAGRLTSWSQIPEAKLAAPVSSVGFPQGEGAQVVFETAFLDSGTPFGYQPKLVQTSSQARREIIGRSGAIGWLDLAYTSGMNVLSVDGIPCTRTTVQSGSYPARRGLNFVTRGAPTGAAARFITWVRDNPVARRVVETRYVAAG